MERRNFIKSSLGIGLGATLPGMTHSKSGKEAETAVSPAMPVKSGKPHIILIMTDQQRGDALGCMGNKAVISPNIDRLAQEGSLFVSGYSSAPSSTPGRAGLLTGMSPWHHGMLGYGRMALKYRYEMPQMMRNLGYYTFGIGKMHWFPQKALHGFHATLIDESGRVESPDFISDYREWFQLQAPGKDPDLTGIGWNDHAAGVYKLDERLHPTAWTGQTACELIRNYDNDKPLFLKVSFARPHSPYDPPQRYLDMYKDADIPKPHIGDWCGQYAEPKDPLQGASDAPFGNFGDAYAINSRRHYYANITFIDIAGGSVPPDMDGRSLLKLIQGQQEQWRPYIDMEHATCYSDDNYWAALTDGKIKYIWNFHNGSEQLFDLREDPGETHNLSEDAAYQNKLSELRKMMVEHLSERGDSFVKDGKLMTLDTTLLYSPNFPK